LFVCIVIFVCTTLWSGGDSFRLLNTGLHQWPHKQHQYHSTRCLVLSKEQNKILHNYIESGGNILCNIKIKTILRGNIDHLGDASVNPSRLLCNPLTACTHHVHNTCHELLSWSFSTQSTTSQRTYNATKRKTGVWFPQKVGIFLLATASASSETLAASYSGPARQHGQTEWLILGAARFTTSFIGTLLNIFVMTSQNFVLLITTTKTVENWAIFKSAMGRGPLNSPTASLTLSPALSGSGVALASQILLEPMLIIHSHITFHISSTPKTPK